MKLLLDTHVFLWYITADPKLPAAFRAAIQELSNEVFLSAASVWEAVIKHNLGKLSLPVAPADYLPPSFFPAAKVMNCGLTHTIPGEDMTDDNAP